VVELLLFSLSLFSRALTSFAKLNSEKIEVAEHSSTAHLSFATGYSCVSLWHCIEGPGVAWLNTIVVSSSRCFN